MTYPTSSQPSKPVYRCDQSEFSASHRCFECYRRNILSSSRPRCGVPGVPCPRCGVLGGVPIVYGLPGLGLDEALDSGQLVLGGCLIGQDDPDWTCRHCGFFWEGTGG